MAAVAIVSLGACTPEWWISHYFPEQYDKAANVAWCESRMQPDAVSPGGGNHGLFQINNVHADSFERVTGVPWETGRYHPGINTRFARWLYDQQGWGPWTCG